MKAVKFGDICRLQYGSNLPTKQRRPGGIRVFGSNGIVGSHDEAITSGPTVVLGRKGSIGKVAYSEMPCWPIDTTYYVDRSLTSCDLEWLSLLLRSFPLHELNKASGVPGLNRDDVYALSVNMPSAVEQRRIAARLKAQLAAAEQARQAATAQLAEVAALRQAIYRDAFGACNSFPEVLLAEVAPVQSGYAFKSRDFKPSGMRLLRNANILPGRVYWDSAVFLDAADAVGLDRFALHEGDVLLSLDRPLIADGLKVARVSSRDLPALLVQRVARFEVDRKRLDQDYLYAYLNSTQFIEAIKGHDQSLGVPHISPKQVGAIGMPLPPLDQQRSMVQSLNQQLSAAWKLKEAVESQAADLEALPARLLAQAFDSSDHDDEDVLNMVTEA